MMHVTKPMGCKQACQPRMPAAVLYCVLLKVLCCKIKHVFFKKKKKAREFQKNIYFCFTDYAKAFDCGSQ